MTDQPTETERLKEAVADAIRTVFDPEIPVNVYDLGLIYDVAIDDDRRVTIRMTLTTPNCPVAESLPAKVQQVARGVEGVADASIDLVWTPKWNPDMMSEAARLELEFTGHTGPAHTRRDPFTSLTTNRTNRPGERPRQ